MINSFEKNKDKPNFSELKSSVLLVFVFTTIIVFWMISPLLSTEFFPANKYNWEILSKIGDSFGVFSSIASGLALLGIVYSIFFNQRELILQRQLAERQMRISILTTKLTMVSKNSEEHDRIIAEIDKIEQSFSHGD
jgi:hypothetical protein